MATLVDSSIFIAIERNDLDLDRVLECCGDIELVLSAVTASELLHGVHRLRTSTKKVRAEIFDCQECDDLVEGPFHEQLHL